MAVTGLPTFWFAPVFSLTARVTASGENTGGLFWAEAGAARTARAIAAKARTAPLLPARAASLRVPRPGKPLPEAVAGNGSFLDRCARSAGVAVCRRGGVARAPRAPAVTLLSESLITCVSPRVQACTGQAIQVNIESIADRRPQMTPSPLKSGAP